MLVKVLSWNHRKGGKQTKFLKRCIEGNSISNITKLNKRTYFSSLKYIIWASIQPFLMPKFGYKGLIPCSDFIGCD